MKQIALVMVVLVAACGNESKDTERKRDTDHERERDRDRDRDRDRARDRRDDLDTTLAEKQRALEEAQKIADQATKEAQDAGERVERLQRDLEELSTKTQAAIDAVVNAQTDADRATAKATLERLRQEQADYQRRLAEAKANAARAVRIRGSTVSKECQENPLAKGCM